MSTTSDEIKASAKLLTTAEKERLREIERNENRINEIGARVEEIDQTIEPLEIERKKLLEEWYQLRDQALPEENYAGGRVKAKRDTTPQENYNKAVDAFFTTLSPDDGVKTSQIRESLEGKGLTSISKIRMALDRHNHEGDRAKRVYFKHIKAKA